MPIPIQLLPAILTIFEAGKWTSQKLKDWFKNKTKEQIEELIRNGEIDLDVSEKILEELNNSITISIENKNILNNGVPFEKYDKERSLREKFEKELIEIKHKEELELLNKKEEVRFNREDLVEFINDYKLTNPKSFINIWTSRNVDQNSISFFKRKGISSVSEKLPNKRTIFYLEFNNKELKVIDSFYKEFL